MAVIGYRRVSTVLQNLDRQLADVEVDELFEDKVSGKDTKRPALKEALRFARKGDTFVVHSMDRLARNLVDLRSIVDELREKGVTVRFMKENVEVRPRGQSDGDAMSEAMNDLLLNMFGMMAEFERAIMLERQREGIAIAKAKGKYRGKRRSLTDEQAKELRERHAKGEGMTALAREYGIARPTAYKYLERGKSS